MLCAQGWRFRRDGEERGQVGVELALRVGVHARELGVGCAGAVVDCTRI